MVEGFYPKTVKEAAALLKEYTDCMLTAGGTDIMVIHKRAAHVIFVNQVSDIKEIRKKDGILSIGAGCTYTELLQHPDIPEILKAAMSQIASPAIRSTGTVAGNICNASPAGDTLPVLYALDAVVVTSFLGEDGSVCTRKVPIQKFILGIRKIALEAQELVTAIEIREAVYQNATSVYYQKVGARQSEAISKLSFAALAETKDNRILDLRIAFGSVGITVIRREELEGEMKGLTMEELKEKSGAVLEQYDACIHPISDQRSTTEYRKKVCMNLLADFLKQIK